MPVPLSSRTRGAARRPGGAVVPPGSGHPGAPGWRSGLRGFVGGRGLRGGRSPASRGRRRGRRGDDRHRVGQQGDRAGGGPAAAGGQEEAGNQAEAARSAAGNRVGAGTATGAKPSHGRSTTPVGPRWAIAAGGAWGNEEAARGFPARRLAPPRPSGRWFVVSWVVNQEWVVRSACIGRPAGLRRSDPVVALLAVFGEVEARGFDFLGGTQSDCGLHDEGDNQGGDHQRTG